MIKRINLVDEVMCQKYCIQVALASLLYILGGTILGCQDYGRFDCLNDEQGCSGNMEVTLDQSIMSDQRVLVDMLVDMSLQDHDVPMRDMFIRDAFSVDADLVDISECGNGRVEDGEECDEAGVTPNCSDTCQLIICGNGRVEDGEECDEAGFTPNCSDTCQLIICGNGRVEQGEACDDGNDNENDLCIDECQSSFPEIEANGNPVDWVETFSSSNLNLPTLSQHCQGDFNSVSDITNLYYNREGRESYNMIVDPSQIWLDLSNEIVSEQPIKIDADFYISDGYNRYAEMIFTNSVFNCDATINGALIKHFDQKHSDPPVQVSAKIEPDGELIYFAGTGNADMWVTMTIIYIPRTGRVRFFYNGQYLGQTLYNPGTRPTHLRIRTGYNREESAASPISVSNLRIFQDLR